MPIFISNLAPRALVIMLINNGFHWDFSIAEWSLSLFCQACAQQFLFCIFQKQLISQFLVMHNLHFSYCQLIYLLIKLFNLLLIAFFCKSPTSNRAVFVEFQITIQFSINIRYYYHCSMCECTLVCHVLCSDVSHGLRPGPGHAGPGTRPRSSGHWAPITGHTPPPCALPRTGDIGNNTMYTM